MKHEAEFDPARPTTIKTKDKENKS